MNAIRQFVTIKNNYLEGFQLPIDFKANRVEIIIIPVEDDKIELSQETKSLLDQRLENYLKNPNDVNDFSETLKKIRKDLL